MGKTFTKEEGVKMNSSLDFGSIGEGINEFEFILETICWFSDFSLKYYYRITDDNYIQLARIVEDDDIEIISQYKLRHKNIKENIVFILKTNIEVRMYFEGKQDFSKSPLFTQSEYNQLVQSIKDEKASFSNKAQKFRTPTIEYLDEAKYSPKPTGTDEHNWEATCPNSSNHKIMINTKSDSWGCGYCCRKGGLEELKDWIHEIKMR